MKDSPFTVANVSRLVWRIGVIRVAMLFLAVFLPIALILAVIVSLLGRPEDGTSLVIRGVCSAAALLVGMVLFLYLVLRAGTTIKVGQRGD